MTVSVAVNAILVWLTSLGVFLYRGTPADYGYNRASNK